MSLPGLTDFYNPCHNETVHIINYWSKKIPICPFSILVSFSQTMRASLLTVPRKMNCPSHLLPESICSISSNGRSFSFTNSSFCFWSSSIFWFVQNPSCHLVNNWLTSVQWINFNVAKTSYYTFLKKKNRKLSHIFIKRAKKSIIDFRKCHWKWHNIDTRVKWNTSYFFFKSMRVIDINVIENFLLHTLCMENANWVLHQFRGIVR